MAKGDKLLIHRFALKLRTETIINEDNLFQICAGGKAGDEEINLHSKLGNSGLSGELISSFLEIS